MDDGTGFKKINDMEDLGSSGKVSLGLVLGTVLQQGMIMRMSKGFVSGFYRMMGKL